MNFSTYDRDADLSSENCAASHGGGWWYRDCSDAVLTGAGKFYMWFTDLGEGPLNYAEMMVRRVT